MPQWMHWLPLVNAVLLLVVVGLAAWIAYTVGRAIGQTEQKQWQSMSREERRKHLEDQTL